MSLPRLAVICDLVEENWPSMDLVGEMLFSGLQQEHADSIHATFIRPSMRRRFTRLPALACRSTFNADRLMNRLWDYPRQMRRIRTDFDLFHVIDHSYAQLVHQLPPARTVITCHDLDTFRCLLTPMVERRGRALRAVAKHALEGLRKAARVTCVSAATRDQLLEWELLQPERVRVIPNGVHPAYSPEPDPRADAEAERWLDQPRVDSLDLLHVGSTIQRKRVDVLLRVFGALRQEFPQARLVRVGGAFTIEQIKLIEHLKLADSILVLPFLEREVLASVYRRAALVLQPSEREGFGLPVIEAMACGTPVVASDLAVLREVGGDAVAYCAVADVNRWSELIGELLRERQKQPEHWVARRTAGLAQAAKFSWAEYAKRMVSLYQELLCA